MQPFNASEYLLDRRLIAGDGGHVAIRGRDRSITYAQLLDRVGRASAGLRELGLRSEERVLLVMLDGVDFVATFLGAMRIGAVPLPLNPLLPVRDLAHAAVDSRARVAVVSGARADIAEELREGAPELTQVVVDVPEAGTDPGPLRPGRTRPASGCARPARPGGRSSRCTGTSTFA